MQVIITTLFTFSGFIIFLTLTLTFCLNLKSKLSIPVNLRNYFQRKNVHNNFFIIKQKIFYIRMYAYI